MTIKILVLSTIISPIGFSKEKPNKGFEFSVGTAIVYYITGGKVYLGADTQFNHANSKSYGCKIYHQKNITWAVAGVTKMKNFDVNQIIRSAFSENLSFHASMEKTQKQIIQDLRIILDEYVAYKIAKGKSLEFPLVSTFACTYEMGKLVFNHTAYYLEQKNGKNAIVLKIVLTEKSINVENTFGMFGYNYSFKKTLELFSEKMKSNTVEGRSVDIKHRSGFRLINVEDFVYYMVYAETLTTPEEVGGPIVVAEIRDGSLKWKYNNSNCPS